MCRGGFLTYGVASFTITRLVKIELANIFHVGLLKSHSVAAGRYLYAKTTAATLRTVRDTLIPSAASLLTVVLLRPC